MGTRGPFHHDVEDFYVTTIAASINRPRAHVSAARRTDEISPLAKSWTTNASPARCDQRLAMSHVSAKA